MLVARARPISCSVTVFSLHIYITVVGSTRPAEVRPALLPMISQPVQCYGWLDGGWSRVRQTQYGEYRLRTESENTNITITLRVQAFNTYYVQQTDKIFFVKHSYY